MPNTHIYLKDKDYANFMLLKHKQKKQIRLEIQKYLSKLIHEAKNLNNS